MMIGGMPEVVKTFAKTGNIKACQKTLNDLLRTFRDDFAKYKKRIPTARLHEVFESIVFQAGNKFKYSKVCPDTSSSSVKSVLDLLVLAGLAYRVYHSSAQGLPLGAQVKPKRFKTILLDVGLHQRILGLDLSKLMVSNDFETINKGAVAEMFVAQELRGSSDPSNPQELYYWHRETRQSNAEVDYIIQHDANILPIEVKSGGSGSMQSMRMFMKDRNIISAIRTSLENFGAIDNIDIVPLYAIAAYVYS
jgi:predicted AAA+ superfamily ATPase